VPGPGRDRFVAPELAAATRLLDRAVAAAERATSPWD
jgi:hypothetical protein